MQDDPPEQVYCNVNATLIGRNDKTILENIRIFNKNLRHGSFAKQQPYEKLFIRGSIPHSLVHVYPHFLFIQETTTSSLYDERNLRVGMKIGVRNKMCVTGRDK